MPTAVAHVLVVPIMIVTVLAFGAVIRRLLGVRVGLVRTGLAAVLAIWVAGRIMLALAGPEPADTGTALLLMLLAVCCASLLSMIVLVVAEAIVPDGSLPGPLELWRGWRAQRSRTRRYWQIVRIAVRHGLGRFLRGQRHDGLESVAARRRLAVSVRQALDDGGVTFVKLGQQLSTRRDVLPGEFAEELARLQDQAAPVSWAQITAVLRAELGRPVEEVFAHVEAAPLAAASVAQVHAARLLDGAEVVVKVQRPGIAEVVDRDLDILHRLARTLEARTRWGAALGLRDLAQGFADALREELDFRIELENLAAVATTQPAGIRVPAAHAPLCGPRLLVMEKLTGTPLSAAGPALGALPDGRRREIAATLLEAMMSQVLQYGLFHVDLHPGNILLTASGDLGLLDFGSVGRLDATTRLALGRLLAALGGSDSVTATDALLELVDRPAEVDERELERGLGALMVRYTAPGPTAGLAAFPAVLKLVIAHRLAIPPQVAAAFRAFATLEGTLTLIAPDFDLIAEARAAGGRRLAEAATPERLRRTAEHELISLLPLLRRLPRRVDRALAAAEHGRLSVNVRLLADHGDRRYVTGLLHQVLLAVIGSASGLMAVLLLGLPGGPRLTPSIELYAVLGYALLIVAVILVLRVLVVIFRHDRAG
ncbi:AarF/UbiB family protein [Amorphoplanes nipponensis]|uniref:Ubiquinone biosynthesis protein UbiB n=1 Tax=Actinoplanes nipponensis TaxID=135950 RepID=A0A919MFX9_9ACTN|nr:AarF/UbiB family protein [Actinoplanes nipponensis]GIE48004.1 ubiquinone biosynthesis protein UbiB [Actinoplanes nipponensis]